MLLLLLSWWRGAVLGTVSQGAPWQGTVSVTGVLTGTVAE